MKREQKYTEIVLNIIGCDECPKHETRLTKGYGYAEDYLCTLVRDDDGNPKKVMGYVEWDSDKKPVPDWCPLRRDGKEDLNFQLEKLEFMHEYLSEHHPIVPEKHETMSDEDILAILIERERKFL